jgi:hypothetical protein
MQGSISGFLYLDLEQRIFGVSRERQTRYLILSTTCQARQQLNPIQMEALSLFPVVTPDERSRSMQALIDDWNMFQQQRDHHSTIIDQHHQFSDYITNRPCML